MIKVLLVDDNRVTTQKMAEYLAKGEIEIVGVAHDGDSALSMASEQVPDVVILDAVLPVKDGLSVLEHLNSDIRVIMLSSLANDNIIQKSMSLGADYFMVKPFDIENLYNTVITLGGNEKSIVQRVKEKEVEDLEKQSKEIAMDLDVKVSYVLSGLGMPAHIKGYSYARQAIRLAISNPDLLSAVTKELYPNIARLNNTTPSRVERAIRHAIEVAWNRGDSETKNSLFKTVNNSKGKPTNSEFIANISDRIKMESRIAS